MADAWIGSMNLRLHGVGAEEAAWVGREVGARLGDHLGRMDRSVRLDQLNVRLQTGLRGERLVDALVEQIVRQLPDVHRNPDG